MNKFKHLMLFNTALKPTDFPANIVIRNGVYERVSQQYSKLQYLNFFNENKKPRGRLHPLGTEILLFFKKYIQENYSVVIRTLPIDGYLTKSTSIHVDLATQRQKIKNQTNRPDMGVSWNSSSLRPFQVLEEHILTNKRSLGVTQQFLGT